MVNARFRAVRPDQRIRELRQEFAALQKEDASPNRAVRLAAFAREAHSDRQLNMAMHTTQLCLEDDPDAPAMMIAAYELGDEADPEERIRALVDLEDLARYVGDSAMGEHATARVRELAEAWVRDADDHELRHVLRTLASIRDRGFADDVRDAVR